MTEKELVVSADGHILEPTDLFVTRLPKHLRDRGVWEDDFEIEPLVEGGARIPRRDMVSLAIAATGWHTVVSAGQMVVASGVMRKKDLPAIAGETAVPEMANGSSIFGGMEMLAADKAMVSANVPFKISVPRHDGSDAQVTITGGTATLTNNLFSKLDVGSGAALSDLGQGDFVVRRFAVTGNGRIIQVHAQVPPKNPKPWDWAAHLDEIQLLDSQQQTYPCHGAAAKYLPGGIPSVVVLYDSANPIKSIPAAEGHPTDIWLFFIVPRGTDIAGLKVKNVLQPLTVSGQ